jgi:hypothetical protein
MIAYTAITNDYDTIKAQPLKDAPFVIVRSVPFEGSPTMQARWAKLMAHRLFPGAEYVLWVDGSMQLHVPSVKALIDEHLTDHDMAVMKHPFLDCIYDDASVCLSAGKVTKEQVATHHKRLTDMGWPRNAGHTEHGMMLRRMTPQVIRLCEAWFSEMIALGSHRDQWHMSPLAKALGVTYKVIPERFFTVHKHGNQGHAQAATAVLRRRSR